MYSHFGVTNDAEISWCAERFVLLFPGDENGVVEQSEGLQCFRWNLDVWL